MEGGRGCNALQLGRRRQEQYPEVQRRLDERYARHAVEDLSESLAPVHLAVLQAWFETHVVDGEPVARPGETVYALLDRLKPPALVRAWWALISHHVETNASVSLTPDIAQIYVTDPDAIPARECDGCRYLLPIKGRLRPDGSIERLDDYAVTCPICGLKAAP
jgi:hypothetical protein